MPRRPAEYAPCRAALRAPPRGPRHYDLRRWRRLSAAYRAAHPICEECGEEPAAHTHHRVPRAAGGRDAWDNLKAVCNACHSRTERRDRRAAERSS